MAAGSPQARISGGKPAALANALRTTRSTAAQRLSWRGFAVCQNFSNRRRKIINAGAGHDDAVAAAVSFLGDAQESPAVVLPELHVEMLALDLQFSRLDNVIHFYLEAADSTASGLWNGSKICRVFNNLLETAQPDEKRPLMARGR